MLHKDGDKSSIDKVILMIVLMSLMILMMIVLMIFMMLIVDVGEVHKRGEEEESKARVCDADDMWQAGREWGTSDLL